MFINCLLKRPPQPSHTQGLMDVAQSIMETNGVGVELIRTIDHDIAVGVYPDMAEHGRTWRGEKTSVCTQVIERHYGMSSQRNTTFMTWNLLHLARMVKDAGCHFNHPNPDYR